MSEPAGDRPGAAGCEVMSTSPAPTGPAPASTGPESATPSAAPPSGGSAWGRRWKSFWGEWLRPLLIIGVVMFSFRSAIADWNDVPTGSMKPTILEGDRIFINKVAYDLKFPFTTWRLAQWEDPSWGDVVVLRSPQDGKRLVKRVVGLPGDRVAIRNNRLVINGSTAAYSPLEGEVVEQIDRYERRSRFFALEDFAGRSHPVMINPSSGVRDFAAFEVPPEHFFVMGDNRNNSRDSREFGTVHRSAILGRATAIALSLDRENYYKPRWKRFFSELP